MKEFVTIFSHKIAIRLLREGYIITDIKPHKETKETIFVFKNEESLMSTIDRIK